MTREEQRIQAEVGRRACAAIDKIHARHEATITLRTNAPCTCNDDEDDDEDETIVEEDDETEGDEDVDYEDMLPPSTAVAIMRKRGRSEQDIAAQEDRERRRWAAQAKTAYTPNRPRANVEYTGEYADMVPPTTLAAIKARR